MALLPAASPFSFAPCAMPSAALTEVLEWAVPNVSYSLSLRRVKPGVPERNQFRGLKTWRISTTAVAHDRPRQRPQ